MYHTHKLTLLLCLLSILIPSLHAQEPIKMKFGKVAESEVKQTSIEDFPEADAAYLMHTGRTFVTTSGGLKLAQERHFRIKVLTDMGKSYGDIEIPYFGKGRTQFVSGIKAITYYEEDGKVIEQRIKNSEIFDEDVDGYWRKKKFSMPNVKPGAVIEVMYTLTSDNFTSINDWYFQKEIPVLYSKFVKQVIEGFYYNTVSKGTIIDIDRSSKRTTQNTNEGKFDMVSETFIAQKIGPLKEEAYVANMKSYASHLTFQLRQIDIPGSVYQDYVSTWGQLGAAWNKEMGDYYKSNSVSRDELGKIDYEEKEDSEKLSDIFHHVQNEFEFNGSISLYPYPMRKTLLKDRKGNGTAINYLLITLLRDAGFDANPCLISTRGNGLVQTIFATINQFNHIIVAVSMGDEQILLDATQKSLPMGMLPFRDLNQKGLAIKRSSSEWISLQPQKALKSVKSANLQILADGSIEGKVTCQHQDYSAMIERYTLTKVDDQDTYFQKDLTSGFEDAELIDYELKEEEAIYEPFTTVSTLEINDNVAGTMGDMIYLRPLLDETLTENPFTAEKRVYPIDFGYNQNKKVVYSYILPEGYETESIPEPVRMATSDKNLTFHYQTQAIGNMLQVYFTMEVKNSYFQPQKYDEIRAFYDQIVKKHGEQIVLKKKS